MAYRNRTSFITIFLPLADMKDIDVTPKELADDFAARLGRGYRGIVFVPGGKDTVAFRKRLCEHASERGFAVFSADTGNDSSILAQRCLSASNGIFVFADDETHPALGWAKVNGVRSTLFGRPDPEGSGDTAPVGANTPQGDDSVF